MNADIDTDRKKFSDIVKSALPPLLLYALLFTPSFTPVHELSITTGKAVATVVVETLQSAIILVAIVFGAKIRLADTGLYSFTLRDLLKVLYGLGIVMIVFFAFNLIFVCMGTSDSLKIELETSYFFLAPMMLSVGYCEELFFRIYAFESLGRCMDRRLSTAISSLLFCCGHFYEGTAAVVTIFFMGLAFQYLYKKYRSIHVLAIVHALFNTISTVISCSLH